MPVSRKSKSRAAVFVDGGNFYHACVNPETGSGFLRDADYYDIDFMALARKLAGDKREVVGVRYYVGQLKQEGNTALYARQLEFFAALKRDGVICRPGRMVKRPVKNKTADELGRLLKNGKCRAGLDPGIRRELEQLRRTTADALGVWLGDLPRRGLRLPAPFYSELRNIHQRRRDNMGWQEKAVDVKLAVDMLSMAHRREYDVAYLLSFDGDYTPVAEEVRNMGQKVFAACPCHSSALHQSVNGFIRMSRKFFDDVRRKK